MVDAWPILLNCKFGISREIHGMQAFASLAVPEVRAAVAWFTDALDFVELFAMPPGDDLVLVHLRRWRYQDIPIRRAETGQLESTAPVIGAVQLSFAAECDELDALADRARRSCAAAVLGHRDTPWNTRDFEVSTPQGLRLLFTAPQRKPLRDTAFATDMHRWNAVQPKPSD